MERVPKKNISPRLHDIKHESLEDLPKDEAVELREVEAKEDRVIASIYSKEKEGPGAHKTIADGTPPRMSPTREAPPYFGRLIGIFLVLALLVGMGTAALRARVASLESSQSLASGIGSFEEGIAHLKDFDILGAEESFATSQSLIQASNEGNFFLSAWSALRGGGEALGAFQDLATNAVQLTQELSSLEGTLPRAVFEGDGAPLTANLQKTSVLLHNINEANQTLAGESLKLKNAIPIDISLNLPTQLDVERVANLFDGMLRIFTSPNPHHFVLALQNPSEIRPGGGFLGSYADLTIIGGGVHSMEVHDVNDPDRTLDLNVVPPAPLQAITSAWSAADANWFFNFPDSARRTLQFFESSSLYKDKNVTFDGMIGVSAKVVSDLLSVTGPITVPEEKLTLDQGNFLVQIQKTIEAERSKKSKDPKGVLGHFADALTAKLSGLGSEDKAKLVELAKDWVSKKDLMIYMKDETLQGILTYYEITGEVVELPKDMNSDYFAVAHANIGGGKTDLYMKQDVVFQSQIGESGRVDDHVVITRTHGGKNAAYSWYKVTNQDYLQVFTTPGVQLESASGFAEKKITPKVNYGKEGYDVDPLVKSIEGTVGDYLNFPTVKRFTAFEKNVFAGWVTTALGKTSTVTLDYSRELIAPPTDGRPYRFIFEKQSGSTGSYTIQINAPVGFRWKENGLPIFEYETDDPPARFVQDLTLEKIED